MAKITQEQIDQIALRTYDVYWKSEKIGVTVANSLNFGWEMIVSDTDDVDQVDGVVQSFYKMTDHKTTMDLANTTSAFFRNIFSELYTVDTDGVNFVLRTGLNQQSLREKSAFFRCHPTNLPSTNLNEDLFLNLAFPRITSPITGDRDTRQQVSMEFTPYADTNQKDGEEYGGYGNWTLDSATPFSVWVSASPALFSYSPGEKVADVNANETITRECFASYKTDTGDTCLANGAALATDTTINFDGLTTAGALLKDEYVIIGTEAVKISGVNYNSTAQDAGSFTVYGRGDIGTSGAAIADNDPITLTSLARIKRTQTADWASGTPAAASVGNQTFVDPSVPAVNRKGNITHVAAGSSSITATVNAVASPAFVVTAN